MRNGILVAHDAARPLAIAGVELHRHVPLQAGLERQRVQVAQGLALQLPVVVAVLGVGGRDLAARAPCPERVPRTAGRGPVEERLQQPQAREQVRLHPVRGGAEVAVAVESRLDLGHHLRLDLVDAEVEVVAHEAAEDRVHAQDVAAAGGGDRVLEAVHARLVHPLAVARVEHRVLDVRVGEQGAEIARVVRASLVPGLDHGLEGRVAVEEGGEFLHEVAEEDGLPRVFEDARPRGGDVELGVERRAFGGVAGLPAAVDAGREVAVHREGGERQPLDERVGVGLRVVEGERVTVRVVDRDLAQIVEQRPSRRVQPFGTRPAGVERGPSRAGAEEGAPPTDPGQAQKLPAIRHRQTSCSIPPVSAPHSDRLPDRWSRSIPDRRRASRNAVRGCGRPVRERGDRTFSTWDCGGTVHTEGAAMRFGNLSTTAMMMAAVLASVGCDRVESPFAPDFGVEEPPRPSVSAERPSAAELPAETTDVQPKSTPRISRVSIRPLIIIDGVMQPEETFTNLRESFLCRTLDIYHVEIVKGRAAVILFGPRAANGAIDIQTRYGTQAAILNGLKPR